MDQKITMNPKLHFQSSEMKMGVQLWWELQVLSVLMVEAMILTSGIPIA